VATRTRRAGATRQVLSNGPWKGVRDTIEPFDDTQDLAQDATNIYISDIVNGSGAMARAGFTLLNTGLPIYSGKGQCVYTHVALDGTAYPFIVGGGRLYRGNAGLTTFTDVTPIGVTIDPTARVKMVSLGDDLIVNDSVHPPWIGSNLASTPITGTYIQYDAANSAWAAHDITVWGGGIVAVLHQVAGVPRHSDISWSEPGTPATGWQQLDFDNNWTLEQTGSSPIYAIVGTNVALYYFRDRSIGAISGALGPDLQTTSTHDAISFNVGTRYWASVQLFGNHIYFADIIGRAWRVALGSTPEAIWLNLRSQISKAPSMFPAMTEQVLCSAFEPSLNLYLLAAYTQNPALTAPPNEMYSFDARTGQYCGRWNIKGPAGVSIESMGTLEDGLGGVRMVVLGSKTAGPAAGGWGWSFNAVTSAASSHLISEGPKANFITTEGGLRLSTEGQPINWTDDGALPDISLTTNRLGYASDVSWIIDRCTVVTGSPDPVQVAMRTSAQPLTVEGVPTPGISSDQTYRLVCGARIVGRGTQVTVKPMRVTGQWSLSQISVVAMPSQARPEDA